MKSQRTRIIAFLLLTVLVLGLVPNALAVERISAKAGNVAIFFNGTAMKLGTYNIGDNNYVKLRDVARLLQGTAKEFSVTWNGEARRIDLARGEPYAAQGGELGALAAGEQSAAPSSASVWLDDVPVALGAYTIEDNNYFKLRDLGAALDFCVDWDGSRVIVDTSRGYGGGAAAYTDEQLLALAQAAVEDMQVMIFELYCGGILPDSGAESEPEIISRPLPGGISDSPMTYFRVPGYTSLTEVKAAIENTWYQKFSRRYDSLEWLGSGDNLRIYYEEDGKVYVQAEGMGMGPFTYAIDRIVSRTEDEVRFAGRSIIHAAGQEEDFGVLEMSLVWEDGTWKYGYLSQGENDGSSTHTWADPNCSDEQLLWMAENAAYRMFRWWLDVEQGWTFPLDLENGISYNNWVYYKVQGYDTAAQARAAMEEEWYRHFSRRYTMEQVMGPSNFTADPAYFVDLEDGVYMPECQWGGDSLTFTADHIVSRTADEAVVLLQVCGEEGDEQQPVEISLVFEGGVWKYGRYNRVVD